MSIKKEALDSLDVITELDREDYTEIQKEVEIENHTKKAILINGKWYPKSQMRTDFEYGIYIKNWLMGG